MEQVKYLITTLYTADNKPLSGQNLTHEIVTMAVIDLTSTKFCPDKGSLSTIYSVFIKYLPCSSVGIYSQVHRASIARKLPKEGHFTQRLNGEPDGKHSRLGRS